MVNSVNRKLKFFNFNFGPNSAKVIAQIMLRNKNFAHYIVADNFIGNEGAKAIADSIK